MVCKPVPFNPGDRVIKDGHGAGVFVRYGNLPHERCPDTHLSHPGHRIAYYLPDPTPVKVIGGKTEMQEWGEQSAWECDLAPEPAQEKTES